MLSTKDTSRGLQNYIDDAVAKGAELTIVGAEKTRDSEDNRRMPLHILQNVNEDMLGHA